ncbi:MAG TPA: ABC transporter permease [Candidatus Limnocylindrales bacterium]|nr:ABC transporter permease [Candidatus Limnocylindrales bacterium]
MGAALTIALKDLRQRLRDRSAIITAIAAPLVLATMFALLLPSNDGGFHADLAVVDLDGGPVAQGLVDGPLAGLEAADVADLTTVGSESEASTLVEDGTVDAAIVIPAGLSAAVSAGGGAEITVIGSPAAVLAAQVARSVVEGYANEVEAIQLSVTTAIQVGDVGSDPTTVGALAAEAIALPAPIAVLDEAAAAARQASSATYYAAAMAVLFVFFAAQFGVLGILGERRNGTLGRMLAAPIAPATILLGKLLVSLVMCVVSMSVVVTVAAIALGADWGAPLPLAALIVATSISASGIALLVVGFARTEDQAGAITSMVAMTLAVLGGSFFPLTAAPEFLTRLSLLTPHAWFLSGVAELAGGGGFAAIAPALGVLLAIGIVTGGLGLLRARAVVLAR